MFFGKIEGFSGLAYFEGESMKELVYCQDYRSINA